jgi:NAD(P)H-hydrate repair Nnr-like enzyme with NAD(P)H-hydrate dehydratase domain
VQAWVLGCGVEPDAGDGQVEAVLAAFGEQVPAVVDAGALTVLARPQARGLLGPHLVLTPHAGELAELLTSWPGGPGGADEVRGAPLASARRAAELTGCAVLLKGSITVIATPDGHCRTQAGAPAWLATAGAGDVLAGVVGALLAAGLSPLDAASAGAFVHGRGAGRAALAAGSGLQGVPDRRALCDHREEDDHWGWGVPPGVGGPIVAGDVIAALPGVVADLPAPGPSPARPVPGRPATADGALRD